MLKKHMVPLSKKGQMVKHEGKGAVEQTLPSRSALNTVTRGDPAQRTMQNYAKMTPMANPVPESPYPGDY